MFQNAFAFCSERGHNKWLQLNAPVVHSEAVYRRLTIFSYNHHGFDVICNPAHHMRHFLNSLEVSHVSVKERGHRECLEKGEDKTWNAI